MKYNFIATTYSTEMHNKTKGEWSLSIRAYNLNGIRR